MNNNTRQNSSQRIERITIPNIPENTAMRCREVRDAILLCEKIHERYAGKKRYLLKHKFHENPKDSKFKLFERILDYLRELRSENQAYNLLSDLLRDYLEVLYYSYSRQSRLTYTTPYLNQLSPSPSNRITFEEWIEFEEARLAPDSYWRKTKTNQREVIAAAKRNIREIEQAEKRLEAMAKKNLNRRETDCPFKIQVVSLNR